MKKITKCWLLAFAMLLALTVFSAQPARADGAIMDITAITSDSVSLRWQKPSYKIEGATAKVTGYKILYGKKANDLKQFGSQLSASATKVKVTGLSSKTTYYFQIKVLVKLTSTSSGKSVKDETNYLESPMKTITMPGKIKTLRVTGADIEEEQVVFKWQAVNPKSASFGYQYYIKTTDGKKHSAGKVTTNGVRLNNISNSTYYLGRVRSYIKIENRDGEKYCYGAWSAWVPILSDPVVVSGSLQNGRINLTWTEMSGVDGYDIYIFKKGWQKIYKAVYTSTGPTSGTIMKVNGRSFKPNWDVDYEIMIVARKSAGGKNYYSSGKTYIPLKINTPKT